MLSLLLVAFPVFGNEKIKVQIVESTNVIQKVVSGPDGQLFRLVLSFHVKAILPDGSHAHLVCMGGDSKCFGIVPNMPPEQIDPKNQNCTVSQDGLTTTCVSTELGTYDAERTKDELLVYARNGKHKYRIVSSW
jgi:hypothetical protein